MTLFVFSVVLILTSLSKTAKAVVINLVFSFVLAYILVHGFQWFVWSLTHG